MEADQYRDNGLPGCSAPLKACAVLSALLLLFLIGSIIWLMRIPGVRDVLECRSNLVEIGRALDRYRAAQGDYPPDLSALTSTYLPDPSALRCPLDRSAGDDPSYLYHRPGPDAGKDFVVLECGRHRFRSGEPGGKIVLLLSGEVKQQRAESKDSTDTPLP